MVEDFVRLFRSGILVACSLLILMPVPARAGLIYQLDATSQNPGNLSDFSLTFDDVNGDMLFGFPELLTFTGVQAFPPLGAVLDVIYQVPFIAGITSEPAAFDHWFFGDVDGVRFASMPIEFTYILAPVVDPGVPLPPTLALFGLGLAGLGVIRRKRITHG